MSDLLIKGMAMPKDCKECDDIGINMIIGCGFFDPIEGHRAICCPLVEVEERWIEVKHG